MKKVLIYLIFILSSILISSCIEPVEFSAIEINSNLVVNARITNEFKFHTIELSRTIPVDSSNVSPERNATVSILDESGQIYSFEESSPGIYNSINEFAAEANKTYTLNIETSDGRKYLSSAETLPSTNASIGDIRTSVENNDITGIPELIIKVNSNISGAEGNYYKYEYDETYKVKTPIWSTKKLLIISDTPPYQFQLVDKTTEEDGIGFCYGNQKSKNILVTETQSLAQDQVIGFPIRQIPLDNYIIGIRYSILVKQYVINENAYNFFSLLETFSNPDDIFSQTQVGNLTSNIKSTDQPYKDKVIGFFEVSSLSTKRIFLNRNEITDNILYTNYRSLLGCIERVNPDIIEPSGNSPLLVRLQTGWIYQSPPDMPIIPPNNLYQLVRKQCGDCSHLGPVNPPEFWIE
ncbi:hypothetical protein BTO06_05475 [Tenacibaculum sp. SZ-18]|uniref:DUF4249 domain-containing protein n=1 Tax=Tenacibaculum sp. SZ-18 TaxID=754423 RepID=UPI000C2CEFD9|nr:DUF4249 domain-containing protein [Tenacibaculum sp. SZ-18]AUC14621.1 hypothetical protein BTO06_05475 [Tenacibaculum sp. SZ-18]